MATPAEVAKLAKELAAAVEHWCPPQFHHEPWDQRLIRAFLEARACTMDLRRIADGKESIRPMNSYPRPE